MSINVLRGANNNSRLSRYVQFLPSLSRLNFGVGLLNFTLSAIVLLSFNLVHSEPSAVNNRSLSLGGFSSAFNLYTEEDIYKPFVNSMNSADDVLNDPQLLAIHLSDILVDLDVTRLTKILPKIMSNMNETNKRHFSNKTLLGKLDKQFLDHLSRAIPLEHRPTNVNDWVKFLIPETLEKVDPLVLAYLVPVILDQMNNDDLLAMSAEIVPHLATEDFRALTIPNYFKIELSSVSQKLMLKNNGRTLMFQPGTGGKNTIQFRGKEWEFDHAHIHIHSNEIGREDEGREYRFYKTRAQEEKTKNTAEDPNLEIIGEVHSIFKHVSSENKDDIEFMAIGIPLQLGEANRDIQQILDKLVKIERIEVGNGVETPDTIIFSNIFMKGFSSDKVIYHSWGVNMPAPHLLSAGLKYNLIEEPIYISKEQYDSLKVLFGELEQLDLAKILYPIDRKANHRKIRN